MFNYIPIIKNVLMLIGSIDKITNINSQFNSRHENKSYTLFWVWITPISVHEIEVPFNRELISYN